jgi:hypothetical protein
MSGAAEAHGKSMKKYGREQLASYRMSAVL